MRKQTKLVAVLSAAALLAIGASMTSFAAGWTQEDGTWVYLDRDGDRVTEDWKKSGANYYWLDEDGQMATDMLVEDTDKNDHYYVDANGVRVSNTWVSVDNEDEVTVDGKDVDTLWYYMGSSGKAYKASTGNEFKNVVINGKRYLFDGDGHMVSGWTAVEKSSGGFDTYYLGNENEGWAYTDWNYLEIDEDNTDVFDVSGKEYDSEEWFFFQSNGKAHKNARKYLSGAYYAFDENGVMKSEWVTGTPWAAKATSDDPDLQNRSFYRTDGDGRQITGWAKQFQDNNEEGEEKWYYLQPDKTGTPFNYNASDAKGSGSAVKYKEGNVVDSKFGADELAVKVIKGKTYLFNAKGELQTGVFTFSGNGVKKGSGGYLPAGVYYFDKNGGSAEGAMQTGKTTITYDGDDYVYNFKSSGDACRNQIEKGSLYDNRGVRVDAEDGNSYSKYDISYIIDRSTNDDVEKEAPIIIKGKKHVEGTVIVSSSGKIKEKGNITIDGVTYVVEDYVVKAAYDKDYKTEEDRKNNDLLGDAYKAAVVIK